MPTFSCKAVLFDLDGVLLDSNDVYEDHWKHWAHLRGVDYAAIAAIHHGIPAAQTISRVAPHLDAQSEARRYNSMVTSDTDISRIKAYPGVLSMLQSLPPDRWAIVTSAMRHFALKLLRNLQLPLPEVFVAHGDTERGKPAPDPYILAATGLGFDPVDCIVIEDAPAGISGARSAGARVIAVTNTNPADALAEADVVVGGVSDLHICDSSRGLEISILPAPRSIQPTDPV